LPEKKIKYGKPFEVLFRVASTHYKFIFPIFSAHGEIGSGKNLITDAGSLFLLKRYQDLDTTTHKSAGCWIWNSPPDMNSCLRGSLGSLQLLYPINIQYFFLNVG
jgi:hypothetical protein